MWETEFVHSLETPLAIFILAAPTSDLPRFHPGHTSSSIFMTADPKHSKLKEVLAPSPLWVQPSFHRTDRLGAKIPPLSPAPSCIFTVRDSQTSRFLPGLMHAQDCSLALHGFHLAFPPGPAQPRSHLNRPEDPRPRSPAALPSVQSE